eukprot:317336-Chlamydomonas_euryale.AAC.2
MPRRAQQPRMPVPLLPLPLHFTYAPRIPYSHEPAGVLQRPTSALVLSFRSTKVDCYAAVAGRWRKCRVTACSAVSWSRTDVIGQWVARH